MPVVDLFTLLGIGLIALLIWAALSPFEALGWWAGWFGQDIYTTPPPEEQAALLPARSGLQPLSRPVHTVPPQAYLIFLSGISRVSGQTLSRREQNFVRLLDEATPGTLVVDDIFPYSVNNLPLTGQPFFAGLWRWALARKLSQNWLERLAGYLINLRNLWQVAISVDKRYGPIYNQALAQVLVHGLQRRGYDLAESRPVVLVGYSGAGQIALGAATYLRQILTGPIYVVMLGGIFGSDEGVMAADQVYYLYGERDLPRFWGRILFPGRWPFFFYSTWNRAIRMGKVRTLNLGPITHSGNDGYLTHSKRLPNGQSHLERTVSVIAELTNRIGQGEGVKG
jgi:hypothetical protein